MRADLRGDRGATPTRLRWRILLGLCASIVILCVGSVVILLVGCFTLFQARRLYAEVLVKRMSRAGLWLCGVKYRVHQNADLLDEQTVFISNHKSSLDPFLITALGLPRTRYFLSGFLRKIPPLGLIGYVMGVFWTARQEFPEKRTLLFQHADRILKRTGESVFLTPEGQEIGRFNKGAFHLATSLGAPIQPIYVAIPAEVDPGPWSTNKDFDVRPGQVEIYFQPRIDTSNWTLDDVESNRNAVRELYRHWDEEIGESSQQRKT